MNCEQLESAITRIIDEERLSKVSTGKGVPEISITWETNSGDSKHYCFDKPSNPYVLKTSLHDIIKKFNKPTYIENKIMFSVSLFIGVMVR